jgi:subtilisin family serine protease
MATPHVSGAAALIASHDPDISNADLRRRLEEGTDKVASLDGKVASGGRLNVNKALTMELG